MRMLQKKYIGIVLLLLVAVSASAQKAERDYIRKGNRFFKDSVYVDAEVNYRKALEVNPKSTVSDRKSTRLNSSHSSQSRMPSSA